MVKVSRPTQDMRFDVPVIGEKSLDVFKECHVSALGIDAGKTLIFDRQDFVAAADRLNMTITAE